MLFDVFEWLRLYALLNSIGPRIVLMYIMHVQSAHFLGFFYLYPIFWYVQNGNNPFSDYAVRTEHILCIQARICYRLHPFENLACV